MDYNEKLDRDMKARGTPLLTTENNNFFHFATFHGTHMNSIGVQIWFQNPTVPRIHIQVWGIKSFDTNPAQGYKLCNRLNREYAWINYHLNQKQLVAVFEVNVDESQNFGDECWRLIRSVVSLVDDTYDEIQRGY